MKFRVLLWLVTAAVFADTTYSKEPTELTVPAAEPAPAGESIEEQRASARNRGLDWLAGQQTDNGSWGKNYTVAVTSFACLSMLAADDEPFARTTGRSLTRGLEFLRSQQTDGNFVAQGHTWIHGQGFATLALAEAYGRGQHCKTKPDLDLAKVRDVVEQAVGMIAASQSQSGGWWYHRGSPAQHEGSTTVCAVQALVSADNYGIEIDQDVLARGFEYLKQCQNKDGGFDYMMGPGETSMKEGTAGGVSTLALMKKFDYAVMMNGYKFLLKTTPQAISKERFPYYGHFYGVMGMRLLGQEFRSFRDDINGYSRGATQDLIGWQRADGSWPVMQWVQSNGQEDHSYATAFATLTMSVDDGRLSIFNRHKPGEEPRRR